MNIVIFVSVLILVNMVILIIQVNLVILVNMAILAILVNLMIYLNSIIFGGSGKCGDLVNKVIFVSVLILMNMVI